MSPEHKFHSHVTTATVLLMFYTIKYISPQLIFSPEVDRYIQPVAIFISTVGIYKLIANMILSLANRWDWVKRWLLGAHYLGGTWVGSFKSASGETIRTVEHFEQSLSTLKIRGQAFDEHGESYALWHSVSENIDTNSGLLTYTYNCDKDSDKASFQGIGVFHFQRNDASSAPTIIRGYSADLSDGKRTDNEEKKCSDDLIAFKEALLY
ncbi:hypothetical protein [Pseudomonas syringae]|uniref:hypothetical protein n=1 Tax=Pseudomonas syringae TaxID=317 RepID=UPI0018E61EB8|nr:hypothetical protein [Pseudomonas syringae]MBI6709799.1 hypothetical protein [Pseudomonas syringae]MBI6739891.1 hypothetical protein [Pseudomonas syringae]MBI6745210.1 hypothetical protein [Pseudomonas syringae]MBI6759510.1 hypothetical protein [Pseudomonas syringae]MBI6825847.1 hypothetical protein [Pseudomonas syringae]